MRIAKISIIVFFCWSCSPKIIDSQRTIRDSVIIREVEKEILIPESSGESFKIALDSLRDLLAAGVDPRIIERTLIREDPETKMQVGILIDSLGNLMATCTQQERMISILIEEREIWRKDLERIVIEKKKNFFTEIYDFLSKAAFLLVILVVGWVIYKLLS